MNRHRVGFTIIELLVVAGLMAALFGLVLAGSRPNMTPRRMAQEFASMLLAAQSRALGRVEGAAVIIEADAANTRLGVTVHEGIGMPPAVVPCPGGAMNPSDDLKANGYRVRFQSRAGGGVSNVSPWLNLRNGVPARRESAGQTPENTILTPPSANLEALIVRYPVAGPKPLQLASQIGLDLKHSGLGELPTAPHGLGTLENRGRVAVVFDQTGRVSELIPHCGGPPVAGLDPTAPTELIYFVFAARADIAADATLTNDKAAWVAISPQTGRINVSSNVPGASLVINRENARKGVAVGK
jgi:type II secretory pathway pseudopilin PulG